VFVPVLLAVTSIATSSEVDYSRDVRPILAAKCFVCHGPDPSSREANLRLDLREGALADLGDGFHAIVPGDPDGSEAIFRVQSEDADLRMPPKGEPLTEQEIKILRRWIADGAPYANHWAYEPMRAAEPPAFQWKAASDGAP
jgi:mono/diheme cytochrome c family protein